MVGRGAKCSYERRWWLKPARFEYFAPSTVREAVELLVAHGEEAKLLAGGQSLVPMMNLRLAQPGVLIDLNRISELAYIRDEGDRIAIGAMTRHSEVERSPVVQRACPMLSHAVRNVGYPAIRNRGTLGGSLAHSDPVAEMPCVAVTFDAELVVVGPEGRRVIPSTEFFVTHFMTVLEPTEVLVEVRFPRLGEQSGWDFQEFAKKSHEYPIVSVGVELQLEDSMLDRARIGISGGGDRAIRATEAEELLRGQPASTAAFEEASEAAAMFARPTGDIHGSEEHRRHLIKVLTRRVLESAASKAGVVS
jgi:CO/xanthine dehydrogenase FAD-binding subunit